MNIPGVPEFISRQAYVALMESLGLNPLQLKELRFGIDGIYAEVKTRDPDPLEANQLATHRIYIPVRDDLR